MKTATTRLAVLLTLSLAGSLCIAQPGSFARATMSHISIAQCRPKGGERDGYQLNVSTLFVVTNVTHDTILIPKTIDLVPVVRVALSEEDANNGKFLFERSDEYNYAHADFLAPTLSDFNVLRPGEKVDTHFAPVVLEASAVKHGSSVRLTPGKYWITFGFFPLPEYFNWKHEEVENFQTKWRSMGRMDQHLVWSDPFPLEFPAANTVQPCNAAHRK